MRCIGPDPPLQPWASQCNQGKGDRHTAEGPILASSHPQQKPHQDRNLHQEDEEQCVPEKPSGCPGHSAPSRTTPRSTRLRHRAQPMSCASTTTTVPQGWCEDTQADQQSASSEEVGARQPSLFHHLRPATGTILKIVHHQSQGGIDNNAGIVLAKYWSFGPMHRGGGASQARVGCQARRHFRNWCRCGRS